MCNMGRNKKRFLIISLVLILAIPASYFLSGFEKLELNEQTRASAPGSFASLPSGITHYEYTGDPEKPFVILIHGFSVPYFIYDPTVPALANAGYSVLRYDVYGRGFSDRPETDYDLDLYLAQLNELLAYLNADRPLHLVGLSQGAPVAAAFANRNSARVVSLTLIDPLIQQVTPAGILPMGISLIGEYFARVALVPHILPASQPKDFHHPENFPDFEERYREQLQYKGFTRAILSSIRHLPGLDPLAEYQAAEEKGIPIQLIWGRHDQTIPYSDIEQLKDTIALKLHIIEDAGHIPHFEQAQAVNPILINFFSESTLGNR